MILSGNLSFWRFYPEILSRKNSSWGKKKRGGLSPSFRKPRLKLMVPLLLMCRTIVLIDEHMVIWASVHVISGMPPRAWTILGITIIEVWGTIFMRVPVGGQKFVRRRVNRGRYLHVAPF
jgi:hypothetical protein